MYGLKSSGRKIRTGAARAMALVPFSCPLKSTTRQPRTLSAKWSAVRARATFLAAPNATTSNLLTKAASICAVAVIMSGLLAVPSGAAGSSLVYSYTALELPYIWTGGDLTVPSIGNNIRYQAVYDKDTYPLVIEGRNRTDDVLIPYSTMWNNQAWVDNSASRYKPATYSGTLYYPWAVTTNFFNGTSFTGKYVSAAMFTPSDAIPMVGGRTYAVEVMGHRPWVGIGSVGIADTALNVVFANQMDTIGNGLSQDGLWVSLEYVTGRQYPVPSPETRYELQMYVTPEEDGFLQLAVQADFVPSNPANMTVPYAMVVYPFEVINVYEAQEPTIADVLDKLDGIDITIKEGFESVNNKLDEVGDKIVGSVDRLGDRLEDMPYTRPSEPATSERAAVAAAISENAAAIDTFVDNIDVGEISSAMASSNELITDFFSGAPAIVFVILGFLMVLLVLRKVIGR